MGPKDCLKNLQAYCRLSSTPSKTTLEWSVPLRGTDYSGLMVAKKEYVKMVGELHTAKSDEYRQNVIEKDRKQPHKRAVMNVARKAPVFTVYRLEEEQEQVRALIVMKYYFKTKMQFLS